MRPLIPGAAAKAESRWRAAVVGALLLAAAVRFSTLGTQSFSDDELFTVWLVKMPFGHMLTTIPHSEATPHLFYVLEWVSVRIFGFGEAAVRLLPALAGTLTVAVLYIAGRDLAGRAAGLAAAVFAAVDPFLVWYSQEARAYAQLVLFAALGLACLIRYADTSAPRPLAGWALAGAAALASHYFAVFLIVPEAIWLLARATPDLRRRLVATGVVALTGAALLPLALHQRATVHDPGGVSIRPLSHRLAAVPKNFLVGFSIPAEAPIIVLSGLLALTALTLAVRRAGLDSRRLAAAVALAVASVLLPLAIAPLGFDYVSSRNLIATLVPAALVLGYGFSTGRLGLAALGAFAAVSLVTIAGIAADPRYQRPNWRGAAEALGPARRPRLLIFNPPFTNVGPFRVYFGRRSELVPAGPQPGVQEVDVIALEQQKPFGPHEPSAPRGRAAPAPPGFRLAQDVRTSSFRLVRYVAAEPELLPVPTLFSLAFPRVHAVLVRQAPVH